MSLRPRQAATPDASSKGRLSLVLMAKQSASTGSKFPLTYRELKAKVPVSDWITDRVAGARGRWILATLRNDSPKRQDMDFMFVDSGGGPDHQKQFRTFTYYLMYADDKPEMVVDRYTKLLLKLNVGYTFLRVSVVKGRIVWELAPGMKVSQVRGL